MQRNTNVRDQLAALEGSNNFTAIFEKFSVNPRFPERSTILLTSIKLVTEDGEVELCDHCWVSKSKRWNLKVLKAGDKVSFSAEVEEYHKEGVKVYFKDYTLGTIRNIKVN